jgi:hypothetical protein
MLIFPEIARKVQKEIENVVGTDRLPEVADRINLPYTEAVWKESLRWNTSVPIGASISTHQSRSSNCFTIRGSSQKYSGRSDWRVFPSKRNDDQPQHRVRVCAWKLSLPFSNRFVGSCLVIPKYGGIRKFSDQNVTSRLKIRLHPPSLTPHCWFLALE